MLLVLNDSLSCQQINKPVETVSTVGLVCFQYTLFVTLSYNIRNITQATRPKAASVKNSLELVTGASLESLNLPSQRELESTATDGAVPLYFDSEEGRAFLAANARKMKQLGAVAVVQAVGDGEAKAVVDAAAAMEAEAVESANGVSMTAPETDHLSQVVDAVEEKVSLRVWLYRTHARTHFPSAFQDQRSHHTTHHSRPTIGTTSKSITQPP